MKKNLIKLFIIITFSILSFTIFSHANQQYIPTLADSGFDADYGDYDDGYSYDDDYSSSWDDDDYSNSWDDDYSSNNGNYSGGSADPEVVFLAFAITFAPIVIILIAKNRNTKRRKTISRINYINDILINKFDLTPGEGYDVELIQNAYKNYVKIQEAWMNRNLSPIKHLLTDEMYNMYQMQVDTLIEDNQINIMSNFKFICGKIKSINQNNGMETIKMILCVQCKDYIKEANGHKIINGNKHSTITYIYELTFLRDTNQEKMTQCPTCGAQVKKQMSATCPYCNNPLLLTSPEITLSNKIIKYQFKD